MDELGVLEDGRAGKPGATCQAPRPLVGDKGGAATATATEQELGTCQADMSVSVSVGCLNKVVSCRELVGHAPATSQPVMMFLSRRSSGMWIPIGPPAAPTWASSKQGSTVRDESVSQGKLLANPRQGICLLLFRRPSGQRIWSSVTAMILPLAALNPMACWKRWPLAPSSRWTTLMRALSAVVRS